MTLDARRRRDTKITQTIRRVTVDGRDVKASDVFYLDTRRGVVRMFSRDENGKLRLVFDKSGPALAIVELRGKVRFYRAR